jgi:hypothetical protein
MDQIWGEIYGSVYHSELVFFTELLVHAGVFVTTHPTVGFSGLY